MSNDGGQSSPMPMRRTQSNEYRSHLPTPLSPSNMRSYNSQAVPSTPESPLLHHGISSNSTPISRQSHSNPTIMRPQHQFMTPESSPQIRRPSPPSFDVTPRNGATFDGLSTPKASTSRVKLEAVNNTLAPAHQISSPAPPTSSESRSRMSSPFLAKLSSQSKDNPKTPVQPRSRPVQEDDVFSATLVTSQNVYINTPPVTPAPIPHPHSFAKVTLPPQQILLEPMEDNDVYARETEIRRPEYFKRTKRAQDEIDGSPSMQDARVLPGVGVMDSPHKGRRITLFQETSEESFEESLMAGGYGRYRTDWSNHGHGAPIPQNDITYSENAAAPAVVAVSSDPKELKKRKWLEAFKQPYQAPKKQLHPVEMEGKGRVILEIVEEEPAEATASKKKAPRRKKKGVVAEAALSPPPTLIEAEDTAFPDWPDEEFPWRLRLEERAQTSKAEEEHRLQIIEKFLERDSDDEEDTEEGILVSHDPEDEEDGNNPPTRIQMGRGKMVPLEANPDGPKPTRFQQPRLRTYHESDPGDALAALVSKRSTRAFMYRRNLLSDSDEGSDDESGSLCICRGDVDDPNLVQCEQCDTWYHWECIGIKNVSELGKEEDSWYCGRCPVSRLSTPDLVSSSEATFVPHDQQRRSNTSSDVAFFQSSVHDSPVHYWSSRVPSTPSRRGEINPPGATWRTPVTPKRSSQILRASKTPRYHDLEDAPYDPTSTPSRGIQHQIEAPFTTPKSGLWSARAGSLFQTPSKVKGGSASVGRLQAGSSMDDMAMTAYRNLPPLDDSPIRRTQSSDAARPIGSGSSAGSRRMFDPSVLGPPPPVYHEPPLSQYRLPERPQHR